MSTNVESTASGSEARDTTVGRTAPIDPTRTMTISDIVNVLESARDLSLIRLEDSHRRLDTITELHAGGLEWLIDQRVRQYVGRDVGELLSKLYGLGFAWSDIARMAGVSVPALRKWRRGESPTAENRRRLATIVAICDLVPERSPMVQDVAAWLEMPLSQNAPLTGIDLIAGGQFSLVLRWAQGEDGEHLLDLFKPGWRDAYRSDVEVFIASDGAPALRARSRDG